MNTIKVKKVTIGEGKPKICLPLVGRTIAELTQEVQNSVVRNVDMLEWRVDFFEHAEQIERVIKALETLRKLVPEKPLLFTFRTKQEGGDREISEDFYFELNQQIIATKQIDLIDLELFRDRKKLQTAINISHEAGVYVVMSNHDFTKTPSEKEILKRLIMMQKLGADITKIAVMPYEITDVLVLLSATAKMREQYADRPFITMAMAELGAITRVGGGIFGSAATFAAAGKTSAPGQLEINELQSVFDVLYKEK